MASNDPRLNNNQRPPAYLGHGSSSWHAACRIQSKAPLARSTVPVPLASCLTTSSTESTSPLWFALRLDHASLHSPPARPLCRSIAALRYGRGRRARRSGGGSCVSAERHVRARAHHPRRLRLSRRRHRRIPTAACHLCHLPLRDRASRHHRRHRRLRHDLGQLRRPRPLHAVRRGGGTPQHRRRLDARVGPGNTLLLRRRGRAQHHQRQPQRARDFHDQERGQEAGPRGDAAARDV